MILLGRRRRARRFGRRAGPKPQLPSFRFRIGVGVSQPPLNCGKLGSFCVPALLGGSDYNRLSWLPRRASV
jgi:hypothetical protein